MVVVVAVAAAAVGVVAVVDVVSDVVCTGTGGMDPSSTVAAIGVAITVVGVIVVAAGVDRIAVSLALGTSD